jgi:glycosyltransferase involved in cell wall biosynthesis
LSVQTQREEADVGQADGWGLAPYPLSAGYRSRIEQRLGVRLDVVALSELRQASLVTVLRRLRAVRAESGYVLVESASGAPLVPILKAVASLTRCRRLAVIGPEGEVSPFGRGAGRLELLRAALGSLRGAWSGVLCGIELLWLRSRPRAESRPGARRRVAYLKTNLWLGLKAGGSVGHVAGVVNALSRRCDRVEVLAVDRPPMLDPAVAVTEISPAHRLGYPHELNYHTYQRQFVRDAARAMAKQEPELIYQRISVANYAGVVLARRLRVPLVVEYNGSELWIARHWGASLRFPRLARLAEDVMLRHADLVVTVSDVLGQELRRRGIPAERVAVHPNGVDPDRFDPDRFSMDARRALRARYRIAPSATVCAFIGTFERWHGVTLLAEVIRALATEDEAWLRRWQVHFLLIGDGPLQPQVRGLLQGSPAAPFVTLAGLVEQAEAPAYLAAADVLLAPHVPNADGSRFFGSPTKLFEYMAMGRGIVASDLDQIGEVLRHSYRAPALPEGPCRPGEDRQAILVAPGSRGELITALRFLVEHADCREALGRNAREAALSRYTWDHNVATVLDRLEHVLTGARRAD